MFLGMNAKGSKRRQTTSSDVNSESQQEEMLQMQRYGFS